MQLITKDFILFADIVSSLDSNIVTLCGDNIIASDELITSSYRFSNINPLIHVLPENVTVTKEDIAIINKKMKSEKLEVYLEGFKLICGDQSITFHILPEVIDLINCVKERVNMLQLNGVSYQEDLQNNLDFVDALALKASDGMKLVILNNKYLLTIFYGLFKIRKGDTAKVNIYDVNDETFMGTFEINKKKYKLYYSIMFRY